MMESVWKPNVVISPPCPRCGSCNTKFCYYNNYSLTQPRYFCKGCRRYWTKGGSLRNVPVGGGCRRRRRGKSVQRIPTDVRGPSASCHNGNNNPLVESTTSTSSSMLPNAPNIDLALVYANFLNQQQPDQPETRIQVPEMASGIDSSLDFASVMDMQMEFSTHLLLENEGVECSGFSDLSLGTHLSEGNMGMYDCGLNSMHKQQETIEQFRSGSTTNEIRSNNYGLPPLPGEEEVVVACDEEMGWSNLNPQVMDSSRVFNATQPPVIEPEAQDPDRQLINGVGSNFELSSYGTFFRP